MYGCKDTAYGHVNLYGYAGAFSYAPLSGCTPLTVFFHSTVTNVPSIIWDFSDGTVSSSSTIDSATHTYTIPGGYVPRLILSDNTGCQNSSVGLDTIKVDAVTSAFTAFPFPVCINTPILFTDSSTSYWSTIASWTWTIGGDTTSVLAPTYTYTNTGDYTVMLKVTDAWGCTATDTTQITVYPLPVITVSPDTIVCKGDPAELTGFGGSTYSWAPPVSLSCTICNPVHASPPVATTYTVTGKDKHGCTNTDTVTVFIKTNTVSVGKGDTAICQGEVVPLSDSGGSTYTWIPATGLSSADIADPFAAPPYSINYMVIAQLADCIPDTNYVAVVVNPLPTVKLSPNQAILEGSTAQINATGTKIAGISWSNAASLSCDSCFDPIASPTITTTYVVSVKTNFGCKSSDTVTISVFCNSNQIFIPNSFTPNNDGKDDIFYPRGRGVSIVKSFRIYNRWGQLLFERGGFALNDESYGWDGTYQGQPPHPDVYVYIIEATCETGEPLFLKGDVTIIR
jgi:gliding motility-associated-like protein